MKKKITALILVIPLIFMFTVFSAGQAAAINVPVSVSSISIDNKPENDTLYADIKEYEKNPYVFEVSVGPTAAANKAYTFVSSNPNVATVDDTNTLRLHDVGKAEVEVRSVDGGFKDKISVVVTSEVVLRYGLEIKDSEKQNVTLSSAQGDGYQYSANLQVGNYTFREKDVHPSTIKNYGATYASSDTNVATISPIGEVVVRAKGRAVLTCTIHGITKGVLINAESLNTASGIVAEGKNNATVTLSKTGASYSCLVETVLNQQPVFSCETAGVNVTFEKVADAVDGVSNTLWKMKVTLPAGEKEDTDQIQIELKIGNNEPYVLSFIFAESVVAVINKDTKAFAGENGVEMLKAGDSYEFYTQILPYSEDAEYTYNWTTSDSSVVVSANDDGSATITSNSQVQNVNVTLTVKEGNKVIGQPYTFAVTFITYYANINIEDSGRGIENVLAVGELQYNGNNLVAYKHEFKVKIDAQNISIPSDSFAVTSSSNVSAKIVDGKLVLDEITNNDISAWVKLRWSYDYLINSEVSYTFNFNAIDNGVQIGMGKITEKTKEELGETAYNEQQARIAQITQTTSAQLAKATDAGYPVVLVGDVYLDSALAEKSMYTTADWTHFANKGEGQPTVKYLIEFKNNVFGNGYFINAHNKTTDENLFKGPLDFVELSGMAAVKGQDNIAFLVRNDNVIIDNVELWGCKDSYLNVTEKVGNEEKVKYEINKLNKVGTVLEIMSDAKVINSRIRNGRTCIRAFGRYLGDGINPVVSSPLSARVVGEERINPVISNCLVQQAREFLLKIGSNRALNRCGNGIVSPALGNYDLPANGASNVNNPSFYNNYVITDVTVKDTVFETSGLFCIGVESHFAGVFLDNAVSESDPLWSIPPFSTTYNYTTVSKLLSNSKWDNLAATSYAAKVNLEGDVEFLDWKVKENIDSSTLIEMDSAYISFLDLRVSEMVTRAANNDENNALDDLFDQGFDKVENKEAQVLHGGVCFYGGGKNYSEVLGQNADFKAFNVNLSILSKGLDATATGNDLDAFRQGKFLPYAAGTEDFRFLMYTNNGGHTYQKVEQMIQQGIVNEIVYSNPASPV